MYCARLYVIIFIHVGRGAAVVLPYVNMEIAQTILDEPTLSEGNLLLPRFHYKLAQAKSFTKSVFFFFSSLEEPQEKGAY